MATIYYEKDADLQDLSDLTVGLIGYGNQGRAQALNLRDSGIAVQVGAPAGSRAYRSAQDDQFRPTSVQQVAADCDVIALLLPDEAMPAVYTVSIKPYISSPKCFVFAHGFVVHHHTVRLPDDADIVLVAPTAPGRQLRKLFSEGKGVPGLVAVAQDISGAAKARCLAYAKAIGCTLAGCIETTFAEETVTNLYCEQAVLCGGIPELIKKSFNTLVEAGYQPELAYVFCLKEVKLIANLLFDLGIDGMKSAISNTAKYGAAITGPELINSSTERRLADALHRIESGQFAKDFMRESEQGAPTIKANLSAERHSQLARTGHALDQVLKF